MVPGIKDHKSDLVKMGAKLKQFMMDHTGVKDFNIDKSVEELQVALDTLQHPFSRIIVDHNRNFFEDVLEFAMVNTADLLYVIMRLTSTNQSLFDHKAVIQAATIYTQVATSINPSVHSALNEWLATTLQACGLTGPGLEILSTLGLTVGSRFVISVISCELIFISGQTLIFNIRAVQKKKSELAYDDEQDVLTMATIATANFAYDNLNKVGASAVIAKISVTRKGRALTAATFLAPAVGWRRRIKEDGKLFSKMLIYCAGVEGGAAGHGVARAGLGEDLHREHAGGQQPLPRGQGEDVRRGLLQLPNLLPR